jgi:type IV secretion system protein VirD4
MAKTQNTKEVRQSVNDDVIAHFGSVVAKMAITSVIVMSVVLASCSYALYSHTYVPVNLTPMDKFFWAIQLHFPALKSAISGYFYPEYMPTYLAAFVALLIMGLILCLVFKSYLNARRILLVASGKAPVKLPLLAKEKIGVFAGKYGGKILWSSIEDRALVVGPPGTGKTTFLLNQILRSAKQSQDFIAVDIKPELAHILREDLEIFGYTVIEIDPLNGSGRRYNLLSDIDDDSGIFELCESLIPTPERDQAWAKAEQAYFRLSLLYLRYKHNSEKDMCSLPAAYQLIGNHPSAEAFLRTVSRSEHAPTRQSAEKMLAQLGASIPAQAGFGSVFERLSWLSLDTVSHTLSKSDFSLKSIGKSKKPVALFLKFEETRLGVMGGLLSALYGHILGTLIRTSATRRPVALYLDEIGNIPPISGLTSKLNTMRSRHLPTWMYWQSTQQMSAYGQGAREIFFGAADLQIFFRSNDVDTMQTVEKIAGKISIAKHSQSTDGSTLTRSVTSERVDRIEGAELGGLAPNEVITLYKGARLRGEATPHYIDFKKYRK